MGIRQIITSDYNGSEIDEDTKPTKITIQGPGVTAKDAQHFELYLSESDLRDLPERLNDPKRALMDAEPEDHTAIIRKVARTTSGSNMHPDLQRFVKTRTDGIDAQLKSDLQTYAADNSHDKAKTLEAMKKLGDKNLIELADRQRGKLNTIVF